MMMLICFVEHNNNLHLNSLGSFRQEPNKNAESSKSGYRKSSELLTFTGQQLLIVSGLLLAPDPVTCLNAP
jgi:hypothetical protein